MGNDGTTEDVDDLRESVTDLRVETGKLRQPRSKFFDRTADDDGAAL